MKLHGRRTDLFYEKEKIKDYINKNIKIFQNSQNNFLYHTIIYPEYFKKLELKKILKEELKFFIEKLVNKNVFHTLVVGLGNNSHTADSIGPKTLQYIKVNSHLPSLGIKVDSNIISTLEPKVLSVTGIDTKRIVESVVEEIKPDLVILIDSFVTEDIKYLEHTIELTTKGIIPGSGIKGINSEISQKTLNVPVLVIGVPTAIELKLNNKNNINYLLSTNHIDDYINKISEIIGLSINECLYNL